MWVQVQCFGSIPNNPRSVACDWHPGQTVPLQVPWGSDTCVAQALRAPSALHIHQPVSLSAGQFIINSCWLVKSGPGRGTHIYLYSLWRPHCHGWISEAMNSSSFPEWWTLTWKLKYILSQPALANPPPPHLSLGFELIQFLCLPPLLFSLLLSTFCHHVRNFCINTGPSGLRQGSVWKWSAAMAGPLLCVFVMPV